MPLEPPQLTISFSDWHAEDSDEFGAGWKKELRGSASEYLVELRPALFWDGFESGALAAWSPGTSE